MTKFKEWLYDYFIGGFFLAAFLLVSSAFSMPARPPGQPPVVSNPSGGSFKSLFPNQSWTNIALAAVQNEGLASLSPADGKSFCANGMSDHNWVNLLASMTKYESDFDPNQVYVEKGLGGQHSVGLLQLSLTDRAYGCAFSTESDIKDPTKNLQCAAKILKKLVGQDGVISNSNNRGGARYWSTLRSTGKLSSVKATLKPLCE